MEISLLLMIMLPSNVTLECFGKTLVAFTIRGVSVIIIHTDKQVLRTPHSRFTRLSVQIKDLSVRIKITETPLLEMFL